MSPTLQLLLAIASILSPIAAAVAGYFAHQGASAQQSTQRTVQGMATEVTKLSTVLIGATGTNGLNSEVQRLRGRVHDLGETVNTNQGELALVKLRVDRLEEERP